MKGENKTRAALRSHLHPPPFLSLSFSFHLPFPVPCYALIQPAWRADAAVKDALISKGMAAVLDSEMALGSRF